MIKIALLGATGWVGSTIAKEALDRGHQVTAIVRDPLRIHYSHKMLRVLIGNINSYENITGLLKGHDLVASAIKLSNHSLLPSFAASLVLCMEMATVKRLLWSGCAATLHVAPDRRLLDMQTFPSGYADESFAQYACLKLLQKYGFGISWTYISPPVVLMSGTRTGRYRIGDSQLLKCGIGESRITVNDYAVAFVDEIESAAHVGKHVHFAY